MAYRNEVESLEQRARVLEEELLETRERLNEVRRQDVQPLLDSLRIASPCTASWDAMKGDDKVRFCGQCSKNVYNVSAMTRDEAESFLASRLATERPGTKRAVEAPCVRLFRRADGTVITSDCPVGVRKKRVRLAVVGGLTAVAGSALALQVPWANPGMNCRISQMGAVAVQGEVAVQEPVGGLCGFDLPGTSGRRPRPTAPQADPDVEAAGSNAPPAEPNGKSAPPSQGRPLMGRPAVHHPTPVGGGRAPAAVMGCADEAPHCTEP